MEYDINDAAYVLASELGGVEEEGMEKIRRMLRIAVEVGQSQNDERCKNCGELMYTMVRAHHHTENGVDVTK